MGSGDQAVREMHPNSPRPKQESRKGDNALWGKTLRLVRTKPAEPRIGIELIF